jgi:hypothetical protein
VEGTQNWLSIGRESLSLWATKIVDSMVNEDATGITNLDNLGASTRKRRFGECSNTVHTPWAQRKGFHRCSSSTTSPANLCGKLQCVLFVKSSLYASVMLHT